MRACYRIGRSRALVKLSLRYFSYSYALSSCYSGGIDYDVSMLFGRIVRFYLDGFRSMTLGRTLWGIILLKLFIMFAVLKAFFFPAYLQGEPEEKEAAVSAELTRRAAKE